MTRYSVTMVVFILIANASEEVPLIGVGLAYLDNFGLFIAGFREGSSVVENLYDMTLDEAIKAVWRRMNEIAQLPEEIDAHD